MKRREDGLLARRLLAESDGLVNGRKAWPDDERPDHADYDRRERQHTHASQHFGCRGKRHFHDVPDAGAECASGYEKQSQVPHRPSPFAGTVLQL